MPITTPKAYAEQLDDADHFLHVLNSLFKPALIKAGYEMVPPISTGSELIHAAIIKNLEECDLVLCDISALNANVFFELGIRTALNKPVVLIKDSITLSIPFDTGSINTHTYDVGLRAWLIDSEIKNLAAHITTTVAKSDGQNPLWRYFGITQAAQPAEVDDPTGAKLDVLMAEVSELKRAADRSAVNQAVTSTFYYPPRNAGWNLGQAYAYAINPSITYSVPEGNLWPTGPAYNPNIIPVGSAPKPVQDFAAAARAIAVRDGTRLEIDGYDASTGKLIMNTRNMLISSKVTREISDAGLKFEVAFELRQ